MTQLRPVLIKLSPLDRAATLCFPVEHSDLETDIIMNLVEADFLLENVQVWLNMSEPDSAAQCLQDAVERKWIAMFLKIQEMAVSS